jgi:uncharacterized delta-60 repeat protein
MSFRSPLTARRNSRPRTRCFRPRLQPLESRCQPNAGTLDPTFGIGGQVAASTGGNAVLVQQWDNRIVVAGGTAIARYNSDGSLDSTFDGDGIATSSISISAAAQYPQTGSAHDGKIVGSSMSSVTRLTAVGAIDNSFGSNGVAALPWSALSGAVDIEVQSDGKIVVAGLTGSLSSTSKVVRVTRLNVDGSLDASFGSSGTWQAGAYTLVAPPPTFFAQLAVQNDGKLLVSVPYAYINQGAGWFVRRLSTNGTLDGAFNSNFTAFGSNLSSPNGAARPGELAIYPDSDPVNSGKILAIGHTISYGGISGGATVLARYIADGTLDSSFGTGGKVVTPGGGIPKGVAIQADGKAVVVGSNIQRYNADGSLDTSFGDTGFVYTDYSGVAIQPDGKIDVANSSVVARYLSSDDPPPPPPTTFLSINDVSVNEGHAGSTTIDFTVTLSAASVDEVTVQFLTANGSATSGSDFLSTGGTLTFAPGETSKTISVDILGDRLGENDESVTVNLSNAVNAGYADNQGVGTIVDDEPRVTINDVSMTEGNSGTKNFVFTVTLSAAYDDAVTVSYQTSNGTATTGNNDYVALSGSLTINPGETSKTVTIQVKGDKKRESNETFNVNLLNPSSNALFTDNLGVGTILNDD